MAQRLFDRLQSVGRLPTPPEVVLRVLEMTRRADVSIREIAATIAHDSVMTAKIMRFINSPIAGVPRKITSLERAVGLVGLNGVKMMALSFSVLSSKGAEACQGFDRRQFGVQSVGCGVAAMVLASAAKTGAAQEAFLAGLFSQIGRSVLAIGVPEEYATVLAAAKRIPQDLPPLERKVLGEIYPAIGAQLLRSWHIPEELCGAIETFRELDNREEGLTLARLLQVSEVAAGIICPDTKGHSPDTLAFVDAASAFIGIERERCVGLLEEIATQTDNMRALLELPKGEIRTPAEIELEVRERIAELTLAISLENERMAAQQRDLLQRAVTDALTGVGNRGAFDARMLLELQRSTRSGSPFGLLMIDVDKFKVCNDTYGHQAGDRVLQAIASVINDNIRKVDYLARYGGEEFAVVAPGASPDNVRKLADRIRGAIEKTAVEWEGQKLGVTVSIGVAVLTEAVDEDDAATVVKAADERLYAAKCAGRNRVEMVVDGIPAVAVGARS